MNKIQGSSLFSAVVLVYLLQSCNGGSEQTIDQPAENNDSSILVTAPAIPDLKPTKPKPAWAPSIDDNMLVVMDKLASYGDPPMETMTAEQARMLHTPTDAVMDVIKENNILLPPTQADTIGKQIPVNGGSISARIYTPKNAIAPYPVIVYYHGGGWVIADLDTYDASAKGLSEQTGAVVVSVHYRQGPEHKFPTAHNDAFIAYEWVLKYAASLNVDTSRIAVAGESAGGNLACNVSIMARDKGIKIPVRQLLVYPVANSDMNSESYQKYGTAKPLTKPLIEWMLKNYLPNMAAAKDPRISLVIANLKNLPPTTIIAAEIDLLQTEGKLLADKLKDASVDVNYKLYEGVTHEFFGMATLIQDAKDAQALAAADLKKSFKR